jgi:hypothetical protein
MRYVIHIGMHKTGTTTIQSHLQANWQAYAQHGVQIPGFDGKRTPKNHEVFYEHFDGHRSRSVAHWLAFPGSPAPGTRVISFERFWETSSECIRRLRKAVGPRATIVVFIRDPIAHAASHCAQLIKKKFKVVSLAEYMATRLAVAGAASYYNYDETLRRWEDRFADVRTLIYQPGDSVGAFIQAAQLPAIEHARTGPHQNVSLPPVGTAALLRINRLVVEGSMSRADATRLKTAVRADPARYAERFERHAISVSVDTSGFAAAFTDANPVSSRRLHVHGGPIAWVSEIDLTDGEFIEALGQLQAENRGQRAMTSASLHGRTSE